MGFPLSYEPRLFLLHTYNLQASTLGDGAIVRGVTSGTAKRAHGGEASLHQAPQCGGVPFLFFHISFLEGLGSQSSGDSPHGSARGRGRFSAAGSPAVPGGVGVSGGAPQLPNRVLGFFPAEILGRAFLHPHSLQRDARRPAPSPGTRVSAADISCPSSSVNTGAPRVFLVVCVCVPHTPPPPQSSPPKVGEQGEQEAGRPEVAEGCCGVPPAAWHCPGGQRGAAAPGTGGAQGRGQILEVWGWVWSQRARGDGA